MRSSIKLNANLNQCFIKIRTGYRLFNASPTTVINFNINILIFVNIYVIINIDIKINDGGAMKSVIELCDDAKKEVENVASGSFFCVRDLFRGHFWNQIERPMRLKVGILFFEEAKKMMDTIEIADKNGANQQTYKKK